MYEVRNRAGEVIHERRGLVDAQRAAVYACADLKEDMEIVAPGGAVVGRVVFSG
jgi:hypothetical protein